MAAIASLRYFLLIVFDLDKIASLQQLDELPIRQCQDVLRGFLELFFLIVIDVRTPVFGEPINEECLGPALEEDDRAVAFRSSLPSPRDPLFYDSGAQIRIDLALFGAGNSLPQDRIRNSFLPGEALKPPGLENSHIRLAVIL
jgi:hypothetical protein